VFYFRLIGINISEVVQQVERWFCLIFWRLHSVNIFSSSSKTKN
jgi:hypothetical protein